MSSKTTVFNHSVGYKVVMALSGLFLISFLLVHVSGNLQLFLLDNGVAFNNYTVFMTTNPVIRVMEWVLFAGFIIHIAYGVYLTLQSRKARPQKYVSHNAGASSSWFSRNMGLTASIVFIFLAVHLYMFWGIFHFGSGEMVSAEEAYKGVWKLTEAVDMGQNGMLVTGDYIDQDAYQHLQAAGVSEVRAISMYEVARSAFKEWYIVLFYVLAMVMLSFHLIHGFQSAFRSLGLVHRKYMPIIRGLGYLVAVGFPVLFAAMPLWFFFGFENGF